MAANKDKLLESAQKNLKKKQVSKAIKDYAKIVEIDPGDVRSRQKLAELLVRTNQSVEAYDHYESVAKYFSSNGFYLKAIAIYKQMQRLDPSQLSIYNRLAELNEKQGLVGNAMSEYRSLVTYYERNGMIADAIKTLEKMRDLDTANLNVRVKLAEVYAQNDRLDDGLAEFEGVLGILSQRNDFDKILRLYKMFLPIYPNNKKMQMGLALTLYEKGELTQGVGILSTLLKDNPENPDVLRLLARGYDDLKDWDNAIKTYKALLELDPDLDNREGLIHCYLCKGSYDKALTELEDWKDTFFKADRLDQLKTFYETLKENLPQNKLVLQTLDSIYELSGDGDKLLDIMSEKESPKEETEPEQTLSDSLLGSVVEDIDEPILELDLEDSIEDHEQEEELISIPVEEETGLELEPLGNDEEILELDISTDDELESSEEELEFSFELEDNAAGVADEQRDIQADLEEAEFYIQQGLFAEAEKLCQDILAQIPDSAEARQKLEEIVAQKNKDKGEGSSALEDLAAEVLDDSFSGFDDFNSAAEPVGDDGKKVFRTDVDEQIAADDMESHYNLGIAYREMGLFDDAISEFDKASKEPARLVDCLTLKALCYSDKEDFDNAERMFQQALESEGLDADQRLNLGYELASLYERAERLKEALDYYQNVFIQDGEYRDVRDKVAALRKQLGLSDDAPLEDSGSKERISFL